MRGTICLVTVLAMTAGVAQANLMFDFDDGVTNPFGVGTVTTDQAASGSYSLHLGQNQSAAIDIPAQMLGGEITITMMVFDRGQWHDNDLFPNGFSPDTNNAPTVRNGPRWGVHTGSGAAGEVAGINITHFNTSLPSNAGYGWNDANDLNGQWWTQLWYGGPRQVVSLGDGGSVDPNDGSFVASTPGEGAWTEWNFVINPEGTNPGVVRMFRTGSTVRTANISADATRVFISGGASGLINGAYFDDITIVPEPASIALIGLGGLALLRRR